MEETGLLLDIYKLMSSIKHEGWIIILPISTFGEIIIRAEWYLRGKNKYTFEMTFRADQIVGGDLPIRYFIVNANIAIDEHLSEIS